jgi:hypothetical protein
VVWKEGWPVISNDVDGNGTGEPVPMFKKLNVGTTYTIMTPQTSDKFDSKKWDCNGNGKRITKQAGSHLQQKRELFGYIHKFCPIALQICGGRQTCYYRNFPHQNLYTTHGHKLNISLSFL